MLSTIDSGVHHSGLYYVSHSSESEKSCLGMFIGIFSEFHIRCGTDSTRSTYHTCSDIHEIITCCTWLSPEFVRNLYHPDAAVLNSRSYGDCFEFTLNDSCF